MVDSQRHCPQCERQLIGRSDKKFCSDQCRFLFNNIKKKSDNGELLMLQINSILRKNRSILKQLSPEGKTTVRREVLQHFRFDFTYHTHLYRTRQGNTYHFCYDYAYLLLDDEKVLIVSQQNYKKSPA